MMTNINRLICAACVMGGLTACSDWDDHYQDSPAQAGSSLTLWQELKSNPQQLSDFCEVLENTKVFRMHKKTSVSYADLLGSGQSFTVVAPVNGSFNKDSLLQLVETARGDSMVERNFLFNHLSRSLSSLGAERKSMLMLNSKYADMWADSIEGIKLTASNIHSKNGVLHVASRPLPYRYNIYEALCDREDVNAIGQWLNTYKTDEFEEELSVPGDIVDGVIYYVDSVIVEYNKMISSLGLINQEDSTYWMVVPGNAGWQKVWDEAKQYYVFSNDVPKADSVQNFWTTYALLSDAVFNMTDQTEDSVLVSVPYPSERLLQSTYRPVYHRFAKPFEPGGILYGSERIECSNGVLFKTEKWPFTFEQTFFKEIWSEAESDWSQLSMKDAIVDRKTMPVDSISEGAFLQIKPKTVTDNWEITFRIEGTLSGAYDVCAIVLPATVLGQPEEPLKPNRFEASITYFDVNGNKKTFDCDQKFMPDTIRTDTVVLAENFKFPTCSYSVSDENKVTSVTLKCSINKKQNSLYSREMLLDCIYLRPRTSKSEEQ